MNTPAVTIIIPTYNWSSVLPFSIGSALRQTFTDFELLVIGDGCTDDSASVVGAIDDERVRWINLSTNVGHQSGPNSEGLRRARGRLVAYLGHDDLWLPHHLECLVRAVDGGADLAFGLTAMVRPDERSIEPAPTRMRYTPGIWLPPTSVVHRRTIVEEVGGWRHPREIPIDAEADLWRRVHDGGHTIEAVPRLTAIKFPAIWRKNVYVSRPSREQAEWFERVTRERDLESKLLGQLLTETRYRAGSASGLVRSWFEVTAHVCRTQLLRYAPKLYLVAKNGQRRRHRAFKGLDPRF
jgi:glycosyltransferase involved in cell wall biosynthesis